MKTAKRVIKWIDVITHADGTQSLRVIYEDTVTGNREIEFRVDAEEEATKDERHFLHIGVPWHVRECGGGGNIVTYKAGR